MNKLKIGLIGCGKQAPKHISGLRKIPNIELVLADIRPELAAALGAREGFPWVNTPDEIFTDPDIIAVDICTPTPAHAPLIHKALDAGKDFFCEKPLAATTAEAKAIAQRVNGDEHIGMVGYIYRFAPVFEVGKRLFDSTPQTGESPVLGRVVSAMFRLGGRGSHQAWKHQRKTGGGAINEMLVHMLDLAIWYFGPVADAEVLVQELLRPQRIIQGEVVNADAEDMVVVRLHMQNGVCVLCQADLVTPAFTQWVEVQGENGTFMGSIQADRPSFVYCLEDKAGYPAGKTPINYGPINLFEAQMAEWVQSIRLRRQPNRCTVYDSILLMDALEMIKRS